jgi:hypothetical protein
MVLHKVNTLLFKTSLLKNFNSTRVGTLYGSPYSDTNFLRVRSLR